MIVAPCKDCIDRQVGCHGVCEKYIDFTAQQKEIYKMRKASGQAMADSEANHIVAAYRGSVRKKNR